MRKTFPITGYPLMLLFKSAQAVGTGTWTLISGKINNKDASLILNADYTKANKWSLFIKCEIDGGAIFSFEELKENTYQITSDTLDITSPSVINIDKPIKISSKSLETNEIEENNWDIELKNNPTPYIPQWKEVGTRKKINEIIDKLLMIFKRINIIEFIILEVYIIQFILFKNLL